MSGRKEGLPIQERRSDEELQAALAENSEITAPIIEARVELSKLREALYKEHITPVDAKIFEAQKTVLQYDEARKQIEAELKANRKAHEVEERARVKAEGRRVYADGLRQRLTASADTLEKEPVNLSRSLAGALRRVVEHPNFDESATGKIRVRGKDGASMRIILGEADSEYFLSYNPPPETQVGKTVRQITEEAPGRGGFEGAIVRNFIGFRVDTSDNHPVIPFVLICQDKLRTSRMLLPISAVDERFDAPLGVITNMVQYGDISLQTTTAVERMDRV